MTIRKKIIIALRWAGIAAVLVLGLAIVNIGSLVRFVMTPSVPFAAETPPSSPDYRLFTNWSALPERDDDADRYPIGAPPTNQRRAEVDVFFLHPTSYVGSRWNGPTDDPALNEATDLGGAAIQASAFNGCCAVYAPRYRQANGTAFIQSTPDGDRAIDLAFSDVKRAFAAFQDKRGSHRPFILAAHSQGTILGERLLYEVIAGTPLRNQLIAAYLIGGRVTVEGLRNHAPDVPPCHAADDLHCVVAWNARGAEFVPNQFTFYRADDRELLCTNPLSWKMDGEPASRDLNLGAVFLDSDDYARHPAFADARCMAGTLVLTHVGAAPRNFLSRVLDHVMGRGNYHPIDYQLFFMNLRQNAITRVDAFMSKRR